MRPDVWSSAGALVREGFTGDAFLLAEMDGQGGRDLVYALGAQRVPLRC